MNELLCLQQQVRVRELREGRDKIQRVLELRVKALFLFRRCETIHARTNKQLLQKINRYPRRSREVRVFVSYTLLSKESHESFVNSCEHRTRFFLRERLSIHLSGTVSLDEDTI